MQQTSKWQTHLPFWHIETLILRVHNSLSDSYKTINNEHADAILGNQACYEHALDPVERVVGHFLWDH